MEVFNVMMAVLLTIIAIAILIALLFISESGNKIEEEDITQENRNRKPKLDNQVFIDAKEYTLKDITDENEKIDSIPDKKTDFSEFLNTGVDRPSKVEDNSKSEDIKNLYSDDPINNEDLEWMKTK